MDLIYLILKKSEVDKKKHWKFLLFVPHLLPLGFVVIDNKIWATFVVCKSWLDVYPNKVLLLKSWEASCQRWFAPMSNLTDKGYNHQQ